MLCGSAEEASGRRYRQGVGKREPLRTVAAVLVAHLFSGRGYVFCCCGAWRESELLIAWYASDAPEKVGSEQRHEAEQSTASFCRGSGAPSWSEGRLGAGCGWLSARAFKIRTARLSQSSGGGPLDLPTILSVRSRVLTCRGLRRGKTAANASSAPYRTPQAANLAPPRLAASSPARISRRTLTAQGIDTGTSTGNSGG